MEHAVAEIPEDAIQVVPKSPIEIAQTFLEAGGDLATLEKMMDLQERHEKNEAKKAFVKAMASFKANPPKIIKDRLVDFTSQKGRTRYNHASLGNVVEKISAALAEHGLSATWTPDQGEKGIKVTCTITHELGHSESASLTASADNSGNKNSIQAVGSTITYLERYTLLSLTGLATHDQDDDGDGAEVKLINEKQVSTITDMMNEYINDHDRFLAYVSDECRTEITEVEQIPASAYGFVISAIKGAKNDN
tara:strand:+ start:656 stop:1405 length:750 start_codon:yes stop_codon:yes gene_type:complete